MMQGDNQTWEHYARAVIGSMVEVLQEAHEDAHALMLETADYWLSLGLAIGLTQSEDGDRLLSLILAHENEARAEIVQDADAFCREALS